jgi:hypothetical protein
VVRYSSSEANKKRKHAMPLARAELESLLRTRQLDRTLTTALPPPDPDSEYACSPTGVSALDARLGGGFPRGQLSEIVGARSSGRLSLLTAWLAAVTARGELAALVDVLDMFDVESAAAAGVDLGRLLWIRGRVAPHPGPGLDTNQRAMEQAIRAVTLVLQAGKFGLVAFDAGEAPPASLARLPFTTWLRLQRMVEGSRTAAVLVGPAPMARSAAGLTLLLGQAGQAGRAGQVGRFGHRLFRGIDIDARVIRARGRGGDHVCVSVSTAAC